MLWKMTAKDSTVALQILLVLQSKPTLMETKNAKLFLLLERPFIIWNSNHKWLQTNKFYTCLSKINFNSDKKSVKYCRMLNWDSWVKNAKFNQEMTWKGFLKSKSFPGVYFSKHLGKKKNY
jgi:hypothetical protein